MATLQTVTRKTLHLAETLCTTGIITFLLACLLAGFIVFIPVFIVTGLLLLIAGRVYCTTIACRSQWQQLLAREGAALRRIVGMHTRALRRYWVVFSKAQLS